MDEHLDIVRYQPANKTYMCINNRLTFRSIRDKILIQMEDIYKHINIQILHWSKYKHRQVVLRGNQSYNILYLAQTKGSHLLEDI